MCPMYVTFCYANEHFFSFKRSPAFWSLSKTRWRFGCVLPKCWKPQECHPDKRSIAFWPILQGHFPLGAGRWQAHCKVQMAEYSCSPEWVTNAVFSLSDGLIATCQYTDARSNVVKYWPPARASRVSSMRGNGWMSRLVIELRHR